MRKSLCLTMLIVTVAVSSGTAYAQNLQCTWVYGTGSQDYSLGSNWITEGGPPNVAPMTLPYWPNIGIAPNFPDSLYVDGPVLAMSAVVPIVYIRGGVMTVGPTGTLTTGGDTMMAGALGLTDKTLPGGRLANYGSMDVFNLQIGNYGAGTFDMEAGTVTAQSINVGRNGGVGRAHLIAGTVTCVQPASGQGFDVGAGSVLDIEAGVLILNGNQQAAASNHISNGRITGYGVPTNVCVVYDSGSNTTTLTAPHCDPSKYIWKWTGDQEWFTAANWWGTGGVPDATTESVSISVGPNEDPYVACPLLHASAQVSGVLMRGGGLIVDAGGSLSTVGDLTIAGAGLTSKAVPGAKVKNFGTNSASTQIGNLQVGNYGLGTLDMEGGTIYCHSITLGRNSGQGFANLNGGTIICDMATGFQTFNIANNTGSQMKIDGGALKLKGDRRNQANAYIAAGLIVGPWGIPGAGTVNAVYDGTWTTISNPPALVTPLDKQVVRWAIGTATPSPLVYDLHNNRPELHTFSIVESDAAGNPASYTWMAPETSVVVLASSSRTTSVTIQPAGLSVGTYTGYLKFTDDTLPDMWIREVELRVMPACSWEITPETQLDAKTGNAVYTIKNIGSMTFNYSIQKVGAHCDWLVLDKTGGPLGPSASDAVTASPTGPIYRGMNICDLVFTNDCAPQDPQTRTVVYDNLGSRTGDWWWAFTGDLDWNTASNWDPAAPGPDNAVPVNDGTAFVGLDWGFSPYQDPYDRCPVIDENVSVAHIYSNAGGLIVDAAGSLTVTSQYIIGMQEGSPGLAKFKNHGTCNIYKLQIGNYSPGAVDMMGGRIDCASVSLGRNNGVGYLNLERGTIYCTDNDVSGEGFQIDDGKTGGTPSLMTIRSGRLIIAGNSKGEADGYVSAGKIVGAETSAGGTLPVYVTYDSGSNITIISAGWAADFDDDGDVDERDLVSFESCATGPGISRNDPGCEDADLDLDGDIDQTDFGAFQRCYGGPGEGIAPPPQCDR